MAADPSLLSIPRVYKPGFQVAKKLGLKTSPAQSSYHNLIYTIRIKPINNIIIQR